MSPQPVKIFGGKKFMWDGAVYAARDEAERALDAYRADGFEAQLVEHEGKPVVYTRRPVKQVAAA